MRDDRSTFRLFKSLPFQWLVIRQFTTFENTICYSLSPTLPGFWAVCHIAEAYRQDHAMTLSDERYSAVKLMNSVLVLDVLLVNEEHLITQSTEEDSGLQNQRQNPNHPESAFSSFLAKAVGAFTGCLDSVILSSIKPSLCADIESCCCETAIQKVVSVLCDCSCRCFLDV
jgi:hypothetical protein